MGKRDPSNRILAKSSTLRVYLPEILREVMFVLIQHRSCGLPQHISEPFSDALLLLQTEFALELPYPYGPIGRIVFWMFRFNNPTHRHLSKFFKAYQAWCEISGADPASEKRRIELLNGRMPTALNDIVVSIRRQEALLTRNADIDAMHSLHRAATKLYDAAPDLFKQLPQIILDLRKQI